MQGIVMSDKNDGRASRDANSLIENAKSLQRVAPLRGRPSTQIWKPRPASSVAGHGWGRVLEWPCFRGQLR